MGTTTALRQMIKQSFIPLMESKGFQTDMRDMPHFLGFRRIRPGRIDVCDIQWEKYGRPRFVLNFGSCGPLGVICHGREIKPEDITAGETPWRGRLMPGPPPSVRNWFRQDRSLLERFLKGGRLQPPDDVIAELIRLFDEVESYWESDTVGKHIRIIHMRWSKDKPIS